MLLSQANKHKLPMTSWDIEQNEAKNNRLSDDAGQGGTLIEVTQKRISDVSHPELSALFRLPLVQLLS